MFEWKVIRLPAEVPGIVENALNDLEKTGFHVVHVLPVGEHVVVIAKKNR